jgi:hypothetical protein
MLTHAKKSLETNPDLAACASVPSHGWVERERRERELRKGNGEHAPANDQNYTLNDEDISRITTDFQKAHPNIKLEIQDNNRSLTVRVS